MKQFIPKKIHTRPYFISGSVVSSFDWFLGLESSFSQCWHRSSVFPERRSFCGYSPAEYYFRPLMWRHSCWRLSSLFSPNHVVWMNTFFGIPMLSDILTVVSFPSDTFSGRFWGRSKQFSRIRLEMNFQGRINLSKIKKSSEEKYLYEESQKENRTKNLPGKINC